MRQVAFFVLFAMPLGFALLMDASAVKVAAFVALTLVNSWCLVWLCLKVNTAKLLSGVN
jgi:hypothetical protein